MRKYLLLLFVIILITVSFNNATAESNDNLPAVQLKLINVSYEIEELDSIYHISVDVGEISDVLDDYILILAQYDEDCLVYTKIINSEELNGLKYFETNIEKKGEIKLFAINSFNSLMPVAKLVNNGSLHISFGEKADYQQRNGYVPIDGANNYEIYKKAVAELPYEMNVIKEVKREYQREIFVSVNGSDEGDGSINSPYRTLEKAIAQYVSLTAEERNIWTAIYIREGIYEIDQTINLTSKMLGGSSAKLYIGAYKNENVTFQSTHSINGSSLKKVTSENTSQEIINRTNPNIEDLYYVDYADLGITKMDGYVFDVGAGKKPVLTYNNETATLSRYPNAGYTYLQTVVENGFDENGVKTENVSFIPTDLKPFSWDKSNEVTITGQLCCTWATSHIKPSFDYDNNIVICPSKQTLSGSWPIAGSPISGVKGVHFYYNNIFEEIDMEGEWCSNDNEKRIYIYPFGKTPSNDDVIKIAGVNNECVFKANGINDFIIDDIKFKTLNQAVYMTNCNRGLIQNCLFEDILAEAVYMTNCKSCGVINSDFNRSFRGVYITDNWTYTMIKNLVPQRNFVQNCYFNRMSNGCIRVYRSCGNIISHNLAENCTDCGCFFRFDKSCENIIEYNEVYSSGLLGTEEYIIYNNGDYISRLNHIRYNYIHDSMHDYNKFKCGDAIIFDDYGECNFAYGNVIKNMRGAFYTHNGDDNIIDSNIAIDCIGSLRNSDNTTESAYERNVIGDPKTSTRISAYYKNLGVDSNWANRYPFAVRKFEYLEDVSAKWNDGTIDDETKEFSISSTGNYFINNTLANTPEIYNGKSHTNYISTENPENGVPQFDGFDYGVTYNNTMLDSLDIADVKEINNMGLKREQKNIDEDVINVIYREQTGIDFDNLEMVWIGLDNANGYKITFATDPEFSNVVYEDWTFDNRTITTFDKHPYSQTYYYKIEAYNYGKYGNFTIPFAQSNVMNITVPEYRQKEDIVVISKDKSSLVSSWNTAISQSNGYYVRSRTTDANIISKNENDSSYLQFYVPKNSDGSQYRMIFGTGPYSYVEPADFKADPNTVINISFKFRLPSAEKFGTYIDIPGTFFFPSTAAEDRTFGIWGRNIYFRITKNSDNYTVQKIVGGTSNGKTTIKTYNETELFDRWIEVEMNIDMTIGDADGILDGINYNANTDLKHTSINYKWNTENILRYLDLVIACPSSENDTVVDIKDIEVIRKVKPSNVPLYEFIS